MRFDAPSWGIGVGVVADVYLALLHSQALMMILTAAARFFAGRLLQCIVALIQYHHLCFKRRRPAGRAIRVPHAGQSSQALGPAGFQLKLETERMGAGAVLYHSCRVNRKPGGQRDQKIEEWEGTEKSQKELRGRVEV